MLFALAVIAGAMYMVGCGKTPEFIAGCTNRKVSEDSAALITFANAKGITPTKDDTGLYYQIISAGTGTTTPTASSRVVVSYQGTLLNGAIFDSTATGVTRTFTLGDLIPGWQIAIPKIKAGGRIKMLIPSALAYGCNGAGSAIPSNAPIYFDMTLVSVQ